MPLKDISFLGFFKIFIVVQAFIFLLVSIVGIIAYIFFAEAISVEHPKLFGLLKLDFGQTSKSPIFLVAIGAVNLLSQSTFYSLIALVLSKLPPIGRIKISDTGFVKQVFD